MTSSSHEFVADEDEYIARLLADDALRSSLKYSSAGVDAFLSTRRPASSLKPNTRFLRNIIRDTDSHNANLKHRNLQEHAHHRSHDRKRHDYDHGHHARSSSPGPHLSSKHRRHGSSSEKRQSGSHSDSDRSARQRKRRHHSTHHHSSHSAQHKRHHCSASQHRLQRYDEPDASVSLHGQRRLDSHPLMYPPDSHTLAEGKNTDLQEVDYRDEHRLEQGLVRQSQTAVQSSATKGDILSDQPSDHSEDFIGPFPASDDFRPSSIASRGRGAKASRRHTTIDDHFAPDYDPTREQHVL